MIGYLLNKKIQRPNGAPPLWQRVVVYSFAFLSLSFVSYAEEHNYSWVTSIENAHLEFLLIKQELISKQLELSQDNANPLLHEELNALKEKFKENKKNLLSTIKTKNFTQGSWEQEIQKNLYTEITKHRPGLKEKYSHTENSLNYLLTMHKQAASYSPLEWDNLQKIHGKIAYGNFVQKIFSVQSIHSKEEIPSAILAENFELVVLTIPQGKDMFFDLEKKLHNKIQISEFLISAYSNLNEQAQELSHFLQNRRNKQTPIVLFTHGESSAIMHRYLDLHPASRKHPNILAWINYNGKIFGPNLSQHAEQLLEKTSVRNIASTKKITRLEMQELRWLSQQVPDFMERKNHVLALGPGFPIYTLIEKKTNLEKPHESFLIDSKNFLIQSNLNIEQVLYSFTKNRH